MPSNWLYIDTNFPTFTGEESTDEKVTTIQNYMFMLVEQLRYTLHNLDLSNMNSTAVSAWAETITEPIYAQIEDDEGNLAQLALTAEGLAAQISDAEGNISTLTQTASSLTSRVSDAEGNISALQETATSITSMVSDLEGNFSALQQTVNGWTFTTTSGTTYLSGDAIYFSSATDEVTSLLEMLLGLVPDYIQDTYIDSTKILSPYIYGGLFYATGQGRNSEAAYYILDGCTIGDDGTVTPGNLCGYLSYDSNGAGTSYEAEKRVFLTTVDGVALKLQADGNMSLGAGGGLIYVDQGTSFTLGGALIGSEGELYGDELPDSPSTGQLFFLLA